MVILRTSIRVLIASASLIVSQHLFSQNVSVTLLPPPPNQMHLSDLWHILLFNNDASTYQIYLHGTAYVGFDKSGKQIADAQTRIIEVPPSRTALRVTGTMVQPVKVNKSDPHYESIIRNSGTVPSGDYFFCVEAVLASTGEVLAEACLAHSVENFSPPILITPENASTVDDSLPSFSWLSTAPLRAGTSVRYNIRITEILGDQSPQQAMLSNRSWFERNDIPATMFLYPFSARRLVNKKSYAWRIQAVDAKDKTPLGESEVWSFRRNDSTTSSSVKDSVPNPITNGHLAAGDQFSLGIFETKDEQRKAITKLKSSVSSSAQSKQTIGAGSDFRSDVIMKNLNATEYSMVSADKGTSSVVLNGLNKYQVGVAELNDVENKIGSLTSKPKIENMLWAWGRNVESQIGFLAPGWYSDIPLPYDIQNIQQLACGANHCMMLMKDGSVLAWGDNQFGQLANAAIPESKVALVVGVPGPGKVIQVAAGMGTSFALKEDGSLYAWGYNAGRELGIADDTLHEQISPRLVNSDGVKFSRISARGGHALAISTSGVVYGWGSNYFGEVGNGSSQVRITVPVPVLTPDKVSDKSATAANGAAGATLFMNASALAFKSVSCGDHFSFAVGSGGNDIFAWGRNASGQLLNGTTKDTASPIRLGLSSVDSISAGGAHSLVLLKDRTLKVGGNNIAGQLGESKLGISPVAHTPSGIGQVLAMATGSAHSLLIKRSGGLWTMGINNSGQLAVSPIHDIVFTSKPAVAPARIISLEQ